MCLFHLKNNTYLKYSYTLYGGISGDVFDTELMEGERRAVQNLLQYLESGNLLWYSCSMVTLLSTFNWCRSCSIPEITPVKYAVISMFHWLTLHKYYTPTTCLITRTYDIKSNWSPWKYAKSTQRYWLQKYFL